MSAAAHISFPSPISLTVQDERWMTKERLATVTGVHPRSIERYASSGSLISRDTTERGRNGRPIREYAVASLPAELRAKLPSPVTPKPMAVAASSSPGPLFALAVPETGGQRISLSPEAERQARQRLDIIQPLLDFSNGGNRAKYSALRLKDGRAVTTADLLARYIAETRSLDGKQIPRTTLWRWKKDYLAGGLADLARKPREDKGSSRFFTRYPEAAVLAAAEYHKPYATVQGAIEAIARDRDLLGIPEDELPCYETVRKFLDNIPAPMRILAREGQRAYNERCAPHVARGYVDIPANHTWVADHMLHDVEVRNDCFTSVPKNAPMRLRFTAIMDMRSRKMVGWCWAAEGDSRSIATALRRAVERFGPAEVFYCDNGKDFKKAAKGARPLRPSPESIQEGSDQLIRRGSIQRLGMAVQYCIPYRPQSKPIERAFGTVHKRLDAIMPHYTTGNAYLRPDQTILAGHHHRQLVKAGRGEESSLIPASLFIRLAEAWVEHEYNAKHSHSGKGMNGRTPNDVFDEGYPAASRRVADQDILDTLLYERRSVLVRRTAVTIDGRRYMPVQDSVDSWTAIHNANETRIVVAFDPLDPSRAIALDAQDRRMADLVPELLTEHSPAAAQPIGDVFQVGRRLFKATAGTVKRIHAESALAGHKSALQHLAALADVSSPIDELISQRAIRAAIRPSDSAQAPASAYDIANEILGDLLA